jgi:hypothetical protein
LTIRAQQGDNPVAAAQARDELRRFRRIVRQDVRKFVESQREAPPLSLWASQGANPRRIARLHVGAAEDAFAVRSNIVGGLRDRGSEFAAIGRLLVMADEEGAAPSSVLGLVVISAHSVEMWETDAVAGRLGPWRESRISTAEGESPAQAWFFLQQTLRSNARRRDEDSTVGGASRGG